MNDLYRTIVLCSSGGLFVGAEVICGGGGLDMYRITELLLQACAIVVAYFVGIRIKEHGRSTKS